jgi:hypothetical protein
VDRDESPCKRERVNGTLNHENAPSEMGITHYTAPLIPLDTHHAPLPFSLSTLIMRLSSIVGTTE